MSGKILSEYKSLVASNLRELESARAHGDPSRLSQVAQMSDEDLLRKWLWFGSLAGAIACFIVLPLLFRLMSLIIPFLLMEILWTALKFGMGMVLIMFCFAIYFTVRRSS